MLKIILSDIMDENFNSADQLNKLQILENKQQKEGFYLYMLVNFAPRGFTNQFQRVKLK